MNSAVALGQLGADTQYLGRLSRDVFGAQLRGHIEGAGVQLDLATESSQATSIAVVSLDADGVASYTFHFADTANFGWQSDDLPVLTEDDWLHIASLACVVSPGADVLLEWAARHRVGDLLRHQRAADGDHRSGGVLGQGRAVAAAHRRGIAASSRPATSISSSWPGAAGGSGDLVDTLARAGSRSTGSGSA